MVYTIIASHLVDSDQIPLGGKTFFTYRQPNYRQLATVLIDPHVVAAKSCYRGIHQDGAPRSVSWLPLFNTEYLGARNVNLVVHHATYNLVRHRYVPGIQWCTRLPRSAVGSSRIPLGGKPVWPVVGWVVDSKLYGWWLTRSECQVP